MDQETIYQGESRIVPGSGKIVIITHCVKQPYYPRIKRFLTTRELLDTAGNAYVAWYKVSCLLKTHFVLNIPGK